MVDRKKRDFDEDEPMIHACQKGDVDAFEVLVKKHQKRMYNIAYRLIGNFEDAGEVVQDAFVAAYKNIRKFQGKSKFITWMTTIVVNMSKNRIRKLGSKMNTGTVSIDDCIKTHDSEIKHNLSTADPSPLEKLERKQVQQQVQWCINTIAEGFREVLVLKDIQGFSYTEISKMLKIPDGTVKSKLYRARDFLKVCLKNIFGDLAHVVS